MKEREEKKMNLLEKVKNPPKEYSVQAFWFWNGILEPKRLRWQIDQMVDKGIYSGFMHARAYLKTPYLEKEWWDAVDVCVDESKKVGFSTWIYDEYAWPSGTAGSIFKYGYQKPSRVLALGEQNMAKGLEVFTNFVKKGDKIKEKLDELIKKCEKQVLASYLLYGDDESIEIVKIESENLDDKEEVRTSGKIIIFLRKVYQQSVDYMNAETIREFIRYTYEEYRKRYENEFGTIIPGAFFDEIFMVGKPIPWTDTIPYEFKKDYGIDIWEGLPWLVEGESGEAKKFRRNYYKVVAKLYEQAFFKQISEWCHTHNLKFTGHTEEILREHPYRQGNYFDTMRHLDIPGSDIHGYRYGYPRWIKPCEPKYAVSVARAYGKNRAMAEAMGGAGWGCTLQQFKQGINVMAGLGINQFILHGFYYECEHQGSQGDWPTSFFYQNPYWKYFKMFSDYIRRISFVNSIGTPVVPVGIYYPIEILSEETVGGSSSFTGNLLHEAFHETLYGFLYHQSDADMIDGKSLLKSEICQGELRIGSQSFQAIVIPEYGNLMEGVKEKLQEFVKEGGQVLAYHCGREDNSNHNILTQPACSGEMVFQIIERLALSNVKVLHGNRYNLFVNCRKIGDEYWYYLGNGADNEKELDIWLRGKGICWWLNPEKTEKEPISSIIEADGVRLQIHLAPAESGWVLLSKHYEREQVKIWQEDDCQQIGGCWKMQILDDTSDDQWKEKVENCELSIPISLFHTSLDKQIREIRICNKKDEKGRCGRHTSLWKASWITRRAYWHDGTDDKDLYFRKYFYLEDEPQIAKFCVAVIDNAEIYINGFLEKRVFGYKSPTVLYSEHLKKGWNLLAVHVNNHNPIDECDMCSTDELPPERYISLLLEGEIGTIKGITRICSDKSFIVCSMLWDGWNSLGGKFEQEAEQINYGMARPFGGPDEQWTYAWERGKPPLLPWGDLPLFGKRIEYPITLYYQFTIPAGTTTILIPEISGNYKLYLDGMPIDNQDRINIFADNLVHQLGVVVDAYSSEDGVKKPLKVKCAEFQAPLGDWRQYGLKWFSGRIAYRNQFSLKKSKGKYVLRLGQVCFHGEIWINGKLAGVKIWEPYELDVTNYVKDGKNVITVIVSNSAANERRYMLVDEGMALGWNRYWNEDNIDRDGENLLSGLLGPVRLYHQLLQKV